MTSKNEKEGQLLYHPLEETTRIISPCRRKHQYGRLGNGGMYTMGQRQVRP